MGFPTVRSALRELGFTASPESRRRPRIGTAETTDILDPLTGKVRAIRVRVTHTPDREELDRLSGGSHPMVFPCQAVTGESSG